MTLPAWRRRVPKGAERQSSRDCVLPMDEVQRYPDVAGPSVLLVFTRDPRGRMTGRKLVLKSTLESLVSLPCQLTVAYFGDEAADDEFPDVRFVRLKGPTTLELASGILKWLTPRAHPLNEVLYKSKRAARELDALIAESDSQLIVTDMIRTASYAEQADLPWIADLDDLLSERYRRMADGDGLTANLLGYHRSDILRLALRAVRPFGAIVLRREARLIAEREIEIARAANITTLVSPTEAHRLEERSGCRVGVTPVHVPGPETPPEPVEAPMPGLIFLGGLDYRANMKSVSDFDANIMPELGRIGIDDVRLHVIGYCDDTHRTSFSEAIVLHGYVDDLHHELRLREAMIVPEVDPGGIKTKIIQAAFHGVVVLAHATAVQGTELKSGREVVVWSNAKELASAISALRSGAIDREAMVRAAFVWANANFGFQNARDRWEQQRDLTLDLGAKKYASE